MNTNSKSPLYFNISQIIGYNQFSNAPADINKTPSIIEVLNNVPFLKNANDYFIGVQRVLIPTASVPKYIVPLAYKLVDNTINTNPNKLLFVVSLAYRNSGGNIIFSLSDNVLFQSEVVGGIPPSVINGRQDFDNNKYYYFVYDPNTILLSINQTLINMWGKFRAGCQGLGVDTSLWTNIPYYSFNEGLLRFTVSGDVRFFNQDPITTYDPITYQPIQTERARIELYTDGLLQDLFQVPSRYLDERGRYGNVNLINYVRFSVIDKTSILNGDILTMTAWKNSLNMWNAMTRVIFTINYGIPTKLEWENTVSSSGELQGSSASTGNFKEGVGDRPLQPTLTDLQVDVNEFAINNNYIQYSTSSISQLRLIDINTSQNLQNFQLSVSWVSIFGKRYDLIIPTAHPLEMKLAFYPKTTTLI
jgi:hypothetical protein